MEEQNERLRENDKMLRGCLKINKMRDCAKIKMVLHGPSTKNNHHRNRIHNMGERNWEISCGTIGNF